MWGLGEKGKQHDEESLARSTNSAQDPFARSTHCTRLFFSFLKR